MKLNDSDVNRAVGLLIRALRQDRNMSQDNLSGLMGVTRSTIAEWERGKNSPSISSLVHLAEIFEVSIHDLIDGIAAQPSSSTTDRAITLAELFRVLDAKHAAIVLTISPAVKARIDLDFSNTDQVEDVTREYGDCPISLFQLRSVNDNGFAVIVIDHKPRTN
jgi:transcriptional regulator with XRE-family HTH domain